MARTALFTDDLFLEHNTGTGHPETARRLTAIQTRLEQQSYFGNFLSLPRRFAEPSEIALVHHAAYVEQLRKICARSGGYLDGDTVVSTQSYEAARLAAGVGLAAADEILAGRLDHAILLVRPPGHHSLPERAMGFCLFNNIAITAQYLRTKGIGRVAILDWDVHHGNGTESMFYEDGSVFFVSLHQYPFYPGTGAAEDRGIGEGAHTTLNCPMPAGAGEEEYRRAFAEQILPALTKFEPEVLLISAGFDAHMRDPLASINLTTESFAWMSRTMLDFAARHCSNRMISFLEGGYNLEALAESVEAHAAVLL